MQTRTHKPHITRRKGLWVVRDRKSAHWGYSYNLWRAWLSHCGRMSQHAINRFERLI